MNRAAVRGVGLAREVLWYGVNIAIVWNPLNPFSALRRVALRAFGARIGKNVTIRPFVRVKWPWKLCVQDDASLGDSVWVDNLAEVAIERCATISQNVYLCTGNHDWSTARMPLRASGIRIGAAAWVGACSVVAPGVVIGEGAIVRVGSVVTMDVPAEAIVGGNPCAVVGQRRWARPDWLETRAGEGPEETV